MCNSVLLCAFQWLTQIFLDKTNWPTNGPTYWPTIKKDQNRQIWHKRTQKSNQTQTKLFHFALFTNFSNFLFSNTRQIKQTLATKKNNKLLLPWKLKILILIKKNLHLHFSYFFKLTNLQFVALQKGSSIIVTDGIIFWKNSLIMI